MKTATQLKADLAAAETEHRAALQAVIANPENAPNTTDAQAKVDAVKAQLEARQRLDAYELAAQATPANDTEARDLSGVAARFEFGAALAAHMDGRELRGAAGEWNQANPAKRPGALSAPTALFGLSGETRALTTAAPSGGPGGNLVATTQGPMIDRLRPVLAVQGMGATVLAGLTGPLDLPRHKASGSAHWVAEHTNTTRSDAQFDKVAMGAKTVSAEYEVSRRMLLQATQLDSLLRADLSQLLAQALDLAAIAGTGTDQPVGILNTAGVFTHAGGTNGKALDLDLAPDLIGALDAANAIGPRGFLTNTKVRAKAMKLRDTTGQPYGLPAVFAGEGVTFSNQVPGNLTKGTGTNLSALIYAAWADLILAYWSQVDILANPYHADVASKGGVLLHAFLDADVAVRHPESFAVAKDVVTV
jgi:HK97 family phage major capsid protein